jgi:hypothetical protein
MCDFILAEIEFVEIAERYDRIHQSTLCADTREHNLRDMDLLLAWINDLTFDTGTQIAIAWIRNSIFACTPRHTIQVEV